jgi:hypothetical protein
MFQNGTTEVREEAILAKNIVIGPRLAPGLRQSGREKNKEPKLRISIILRARMKFLRTKVICSSDIREPIQRRGDAET